jgi:hypothetical protein
LGPVLIPTEAIDAYAKSVSKPEGIEFGEYVNGAPRPMK